MAIPWLMTWVIALTVSTNRVQIIPFQTYGIVTQIQNHRFRTALVRNRGKTFLFLFFFQNLVENVYTFVKNAIVMTSAMPAAVFVFFLPILSSTCASVIGCVSLKSCPLNDLHILRCIIQMGWKSEYSSVPVLHIVWVLGKAADFPFL